MKNIYIFGDSVLKGVKYENGKYSLCRDSSFGSFEEFGFSVKNYSKMGITTEKCLSRFQKKLSEITPGDTVIFELGGNDCNYNWDEVSENPLSVHNPFVPESRFRENYARMVNAALDCGACVYISSLVPIDSKKYMDFISAGKDYNRILSWLGDIDILYRWQEKYNSAVMALGRKLSVPVIDLREPFLCRRDFKNLLCADGIHPTEKGHEIIKNAILHALCHSEAVKNL